jgi:hypothetical protein
MPTSTNVSRNGDTDSAYPRIADDPAAEFASWDWHFTGSPPEPSAGTAALYWAARNGKFAENFADYEIASGAADALGVDRTWLLALGAELGSALSVKGNYPKAITALKRIIRRLVKEVGACRPNRTAACYYINWVSSIKSELERRRDGYSTAGKYAHIFGVVIGTLEYMRERGIKPTAGALFETTCELARASETDTRAAIEVFTRNVPLDSWLKSRG